MHQGDGMQGGQPVADVDREWAVYHVYNEERSSQRAGSVKRTRQRLQREYSLDLSERSINRTINQLKKRQATLGPVSPSGQ